MKGLRFTFDGRVQLAVIDFGVEGVVLDTKADGRAMLEPAEVRKLAAWLNLWLDTQTQEESAK